MSKRVCICGRPNVGKSSLFNRLLGRKKALVLDQPGVTRDVYRTRIEWDGTEIELADLAGLELWHNKSPNTKRSAHLTTEQFNTLQKLAVEAAIDYLESADLVLFIVDVREGLNPGDEDLARLVRTKGKEVLLVFTKAESEKDVESVQYDAMSLGFGEGLSTSAEHNKGIDDLKAEILNRLGAQVSDKKVRKSSAPLDSKTARKAEEELKDTVRGENPGKPIRIGVYGRPNVGKSTLVNKLLGEKRMITSPIAGTTVDTVDSDFERDGKYYRILDTAGIRKRAKTEQGVEILSIVQTLKSIDNVEVALFILDGYEGVTEQDEKIAGEIVKSGRSVIIVVNKWDICKVDKEDYAQRLRDEVGFLDFAPVVFVSAEKNQGIGPLFELMGEILEQRMFVAPTPEINKFVEVIEAENNPNNVKIYYCSQVAKNPPTFSFIVNDTKKVHFAYQRYIANELRNRFGWMGSPLKLIFKRKERSASKRTRRGKSPSKKK